jgi:hypothetical protein
MDDFPQFVFAFYDADDNEVGDRVFALDAARAAALEAAFPRLAPKRSVKWRRFEIKRAWVQGEIAR